MTERASTLVHMRRFALRACMFLIIVLTGSFLAGCERRVPVPENLVLICIDTVRADAFFSGRIHDELADRMGSAQVYRNASSAAPWTIPSVASTLTGLYPYQHNAGSFRQLSANLDRDLPGALSPSAHTLTEILAENDFRTAAFSAHPWMSGEFGLQQGFSQVRLYKGYKKLTDHFTAWLDEDVRPQRFFAYLHFMEAHDWHQRSQSERDAFLSAASPELRADLLADASSAACGDETSEICQLNLVYGLAVREIRRGINHVLEELEKRDLLDKTLVIVYSDHGEEFWDHKTEDERRGNPRELFGFGHGQSLYQELLHVPLLVWHPAIEGSLRQDLVSLVDVFPSTLAWLGIEYPAESLPGRKLPEGSSAPGTDSGPRIVYASGIAYGSEAIAAREGSLKSILYYPAERFEYFDLARDPGEKHPMQSDQMTMRFDVLTGDYIEMKNTSLAAVESTMDTETLEKLKSIGYLQGVDEQETSQSGNGQKEMPAEGSGGPESESLQQ